MLRTIFSGRVERRTVGWGRYWEHKSFRVELKLQEIEIDGEGSWKEREGERLRSELTG